MSEREDVLLTALDEAVEAREGTYFQLDYPTERDHAIKQYAEAREAIRRALTPAPRVVTDLRLVVTRYGDVCHRSLRYIKDAATLQALARDWDADDGHLSPHRVARVALVSEEALTEAPADALDALEAASAKAQSAGFTELHDLEAPADGA